MLQFRERLCTYGIQFFGLQAGPVPKLGFQSAGHCPNTGLHLTGAGSVALTQSGGLHTRPGPSNRENGEGFGLGGGQSIKFGLHITAPVQLIKFTIEKIATNKIIENFILLLFS